jgi:hypothetical protein
MDLVVQTAPYMFGFLATIGFAPKVHEYAASVKAPVLGSKRSPEKAVVEAIPAANLAAYQPHIVTTMSAELDEATILRIANQAAVAALDRVGFNWSPEKPAAG